jgi:hypothetical protein
MKSPCKEYLDAKEQRLELTVGPITDPKNKPTTPVKKKTPQQIQEKLLKVRGQIQAAMERALMDCARGETPFPPEMAAELAFAMRDVVGGIANELLTPISGGTGEGGRTPTEKSCIEDAVRYRRAVDEGLIKDRHPTKTILDAFGGNDPMRGGIARSTVHNWMGDKEFKNVKPTKASVKTLYPFLIFSGRQYQLRFTKTARNEG